MRKLKFYIIIPVILISLGILTAFVISGNNKSENKNKKNMEHLTAQTFKPPRIRLTTNVAKASPSISSAMITKARPD